MPVEVPVLVAFALLIGGVVGSVVPLVPSGLLSLAGVYLYWWSTGYAEPGLVVLSGLTLVAGLAMVIEWFSGAVSAKAGGASTKTTVVATVAGLAAMVAAGPFGFLLVTAATVFGLEYTRQGDVAGSVRAAGATLLGMLASGLVELLLTLGVLVVMLGVVFL